MISLESLTVGYGSRALISDASCTFASGRLCALIGRNGAGKSTLLRTIAGLQEPQSGAVRIGGESLYGMSAGRRALNLAFVDTSRVRIQNLRCADAVAMGRAPYTNWIGTLTDADRSAVSEALEMVGLSDFADRPLDRMSDGECQRAMIARAVAQDTPIILLDEPTSFLDLPNRYELALLLRRLARDKGKCVLFSTHELDIALNVCDDIALIDSPQLLVGDVRQIVSQGHIERLFQSKSVRFSSETASIIINPD